LRGQTKANFSHLFSGNIRENLIFFFLVDT